MALNSLICADVPLRSCSLTHSLTTLAGVVKVYPRQLRSVQNFICLYGDWSTLM